MDPALSLGNVSAQLLGLAFSRDRTQEKTDDQLQVIRRSLDLVDGVRHAGIRAVSGGAP